MAWPVGEAVWFISWLANSEEERRRALDFVALFDESSTVDELGVGVIRDAIADQLSPGTCTVQTRPRYFLFVPWIYSDLERRRLALADIARKARAQEVKVILALSATDEDGVIGRLAGKDLKRSRARSTGAAWAGGESAATPDRSHAITAAWMPTTTRCERPGPSRSRGGRCS